MASSKTTRESNPIKYSWQTLKDNSKRRGIPFSISLEYFERFCYETKYYKNKGKSGTSHSVDRIINELGYAEGNIRSIPLAENARKGNKILVYDWMTREARYITATREINTDDYF